MEPQIAQPGIIPLDGIPCGLDGSLPPKPALDVIPQSDYATSFLQATKCSSQKHDPYTYIASPEAIELAKEVLANGLKQVNVEQPIPWLKLTTDRSGNENRMMFSNLITILSQLNIPLQLTPVHGKTHAIPRFVNPDEVSLSWHSIGDVPNIWRIKESYLPPYFTFDRSGFSGWAELSSSEKLFQSSRLIPKEEALAFVAELRDWINQNGVTKYAQVETAEDPLPAKYVFHAMQIPTDPVQHFARINYISLLKNLIRTANETGIPLVVKRHPLCKTPEVDQVIAKLEQQPSVILTKGNIHDLIAGAQSVVVINSGVGIEALIQGKPVYSAGLSDYHWGTNSVDDEQDLKPAFLCPLPKLNYVEDAQFLTYYFKHYCMDASNPVSVEKHIVWTLREWLANK